MSFRSESDASPQGQSLHSEMGAFFGVRKDPIEKITLPMIAMDSFLSELDRFSEWCRSFEIDVSGTRVNRYRKYIEWRSSHSDDMDSGIFLNVDYSPIKSGLDRYLYVLREIHELCWISEGLRGRSVPGISERLRKIVGGADFAAMDRKSLSRDTQFELRIASYLARAGYKINLDSLTDVVASKGDKSFHVECKRVASAKQLNSRLKDAGKQLSARVPRGPKSQHYGIIALDITKVAYQHNGLVFGSSPNMARDGIREKLVSVGEIIKEDFRNDRIPAIAIWMQIHMPVMTISPPVPQARFSTYFMPKWSSGGRSQRAADRLYSEISKVMDRANREVDELKSFNPRRVMQIPAGTHIAPDPELVDALCNGREAPELSDEHVVLSVLPPGGEERDWIDFSFYEFKLVWSGLSSKQRREIAGEHGRVIEGLLRILMLARFPYVGEAPWLDNVHSKSNPAAAILKMIGL